MPLTDEEISAFTHAPQPFDPADDEDALRQEQQQAESDGGSVSSSGKIKSGRQAREVVTTVAGRLPVTLALAAVTGAPGIVFGVGGAVICAADKSIQRGRHRRAVAKQTGGTLTLTFLSAVSLVNIRATATGFRSGVVSKTKQSPYVKAYLLMDGVDYNTRGYFAKTDAHLGGGTDFAFRANTKLQIGFPTIVEKNVNNNEDARNGDDECQVDDVNAVLLHAAVLIQVKDQADFTVGKAITQRDRHLGTALIPLYPLVEQAQSSDAHMSSHFMNLRLYQGNAIMDANAEPNGGILRIHASLELAETSK